MSFQSNEFTYSKQFEGDLHIESEAVPVQVYTKVRMMTEEEAAKFEKGRSRRIPVYTFERLGDLPLHPTLQATGCHHFDW